MHKYISYLAIMFTLGLSSPASCCDDEKNTQESFLIPKQGGLDRNVLFMIFSHLDQTDLYRVSQTCKNLNNLVKDERTWKNKKLFLNQLGLEKYKASTHPFLIKDNCLIFLTFKVTVGLIESLLLEKCVEKADEILNTAADLFGHQLISLEVDHGNFNLSSVGMQAIKRCPSLKRLRISCTSLDDRAFEEISGMSLEILDIRDSFMLTGVGILPTLKSLSSLKELYIRKVKLSEEAIEALRKDLPQLMLINE